ncbi:MAG: [LysW]-aminoadipate kinase [bacterium]|nr:[LysW]-aminoadipate kinase [bacterium]
MNVIKIGGADSVDMAAVCADVAHLAKAGERTVVVHGGSGDTNRLGEALGHPPRFVTSASGHQSRLTDERTIEIFLMATALVNRRIVCALQAAGVNAIGLSGVDGGLVRAKRKKALRVVENGRARIVRNDWTGKPETVNGALLEQLQGAGFVPIVAPVALSEEGEALNVDGDRVAALVASTLGAETLAILTGVPGVLAAYPDELSLIPHVPVNDVSRVLDLVEGRMKKKLLGAQEALEGGVRRVVIAGSETDMPVRRALAGRGTVIGEPLPDASEVIA